MSVSKQKASRYAPLVAVLLLLVAWLVVKQCAPSNGPGPATVTVKDKPGPAAQTRGLNRQPAAITYSRHARCRMDCRHISEAEVKDIVKNGTINYNKSELGNRPECQRKYALEGTTNDGQRVRIIVAPCKEELTVVTVIDLRKEWDCDCN